MIQRRRARRKRIVVAVVFCLLAAAVSAFLGRDEIAHWRQFRSLFEALGRNAQGHAEYRHRHSGIVFVRISGGMFMVGSLKDELDAFVRGGSSNPKKTADEFAAREFPPHPVDLSPYLIAKYEVSQAEWKRIMGNNPSTFQGDTLPVEGLSWEDCNAFCEKTGLVLPTEAQWEFACRAGTLTPFAFGETLTTDQANFNGRFSFNGSPPGENRARTVPVGSFGPNGFGIYNLHGNVAEFCRDYFDSRFYSRPEAMLPDPICTLDTGERSRRGGHWRYGPDLCRSGYRAKKDPDSVGSHQGFRPAYSLTGERGENGA